MALYPSNKPKKAGKGGALITLNKNPQRIQKNAPKFGVDFETTKFLPLFRTQNPTRQKQHSFMETIILRIN